MPMRRIVAVFCLIPCFSFLSSCFQSSPDFRIVSPEQGQLIRDAENFEVEILVSGEVYDLSTLQVEINGVPLELMTSGARGQMASLGQGQNLAATNELIISASRLSDGILQATSVEF